ncbi:hypothetical protein OS493_035829 [Desmophyllum pertusum]|uniref:Uncharacterized protein n=1 Tax=Desmophyllum pertusum TaxID=174260 RepID=A0A9W9Y7I7_9CNID|nr:hypothetical protein OS493_035829 [Desmophyllum pertusum]
MTSGCGGARPKERLTNTIRRNSSTMTRITETMPAYHFDETRDFGVDPGFLARHAETCNGATLEHPLQDGSDQPYFSVTACRDNVPWRKRGESTWRRTLSDWLCP